MSNQIEKYVMKQVLEHGEYVGIVAQYYKKFGAIDEQIKSYVSRTYPTMPQQYVPAFLKSARKSYAKPSNKYDHPMYNLFVSRMKADVQYWNNQGV